MKGFNGSLNISRAGNTSSITNNHQMRIEYDPEHMWFDYQALFDQTILTILKLCTYKNKKYMIIVCWAPDENQSKFW